MTVERAAPPGAPPGPGPAAGPELALARREAALSAREAALCVRERTADDRELSLQTDTLATAHSLVKNWEMREANEHLVIAMLEAGELREAAELARRRQDEFLAMLAHELRGPLAPINSALALLAKPNTTGPVLDTMHRMIQRQVNQMARLVDDLLDVSRVTLGRVVLHREPTAVADVIAQAVESVRDVLDLRRQQLTLDMAATPLYIDGDPVRLVQVFGNLLHNAAKYTQQGGEITVHAEALGGSVVITVIDSGIGISAQALPTVFDLFTQDFASLDHSQGGLGIGLTVVRRMVELHGGTVEARSAGRDQGSQFVVTLPAASPGSIPGAQATAAATPSAAPPVGACIVLIEDHVDTAETLAAVLRLSGHAVGVAFDGRSGLDMVRQLRPQIVLCDIDLPGLNGYALAEQLRANDQVPRPHLIALTGHGGADDRARSLAAGFDHHLVKPADADRLLELIAEALRRDA